MGLFGKSKGKQAREELAAHHEQAAADELARMGLDADKIMGAKGQDLVREVMAQSEALSAKIAADGVAAYQAALAAGAPPAEAGPIGEDPLDALARLGEMHRAGVITDDRFAAEKARLLGA